jgi:hypothetical protein
VITALNLSTVCRIQDAEKCLLYRKTERWGWRKGEEVWRKNEICGENAKDA